MKIDAGWYLDPTGAYTKRYWDGGRWTESVQDADGTERIAPLTTNGRTASSTAAVWSASTDAYASDSASDSPRASAVASGFSAAVTGATTLSPLPDESQQAAERGEPQATEPGHRDDTSWLADLGGRDGAVAELHEVPSDVVDARALRTGSLWLSLIAVVLAVLVVFAPLGLPIALLALVIALVARRRIVNAAFVEQGGSVLAILLAVLALLVGAIATALFAVSVVDGDVARLAICLGSGSESLPCSTDYFGTTWGKLR